MDQYLEDKDVYLNKAEEGLVWCDINRDLLIKVKKKSSGDIKIGRRLDIIMASQNKL